METGKSELQKRLLATFKIEAEDHLKALSTGLIELEKSPQEPRAKLVDALFREAHTLKGAARAVGLKDTETLARALESIFGAIQRSELPVSPRLLDWLHHAIDQFGDPALAAESPKDSAARAGSQELARLLEEAAEGKALPVRPSAPEKAEFAESILETIPPAGAESTKEGLVPRGKVAEPAVQADAVPAEEPGAVEETVKLSAEKLNALLRQCEQLLSAKLAAEHQATELTALCRELRQWKRRVQQEGSASGLRRPAGKDAAGGRAGVQREFFESSTQRLGTLESRLEAIRKSAEQHDRALGGLVNVLLEDLKRILMLPFSSLFEMLPPVVRDLCRAQGKEAELLIEGADIQIDKRVLDEIRAPLIHLIRNAMDHGIETPKERLRKGKGRLGQVRLAVSQKEADTVELVVADDGAGIDPGKILRAAQKCGLISAQEGGRMDRQGILSLVFRSGVTTKPIVTDFSGRGLGLPIVQEQVAKVNGKILLETEIDRGTRLHLVLPMTLANFRGVSIRLGQSLFVIPTAQVDRVLCVDRDAIKTIEHRETVCCEDQVLALVSLQSVLGISTPARERPSKVAVIVLSSGGERIALVVDEVVGEQETLMKLFGKPLSRVRNVAGAMVSGMGDLVPVLNARDLIASARKLTAGAAVEVSAEPARAKVETHSLLVAEDSITTRMLLKHVLEAAGYEVKTAVDGVDALMQLRMGEFDLVVSDVAMPRMDGFELTAKMRSDRRLAEIPVILVTALESPQDKAQGMKVGANAYIVKSSFDQSNLLEIIERLI